MKRILTLVCLSLFATFTFANDNSFWHRVNSDNISAKGEQYIYPDKYDVYQLQIDQMKSKLLNVPENHATAIVLSLPTPNGKLRSFRVWQTPLMEKSLADKYPNIKNFTGVALDNPLVTAKINLTSFGFDAVIFDGGNTYLIDPYSKEDSRYYVCYYKKDYASHDNNTYECYVDDNSTPDFVSGLMRIGEEPPPLPSKVNGTTRRLYRLALACTGEYAVAVTTGTPTKPVVLSAMNTSISRVNGVLEREVNVTLQIIANNDQIIYLDGTTDPYSNNSGTTMQGENQANVDNVIGKPNYDMGHVFSTGGGGVADFASVCGGARGKAQAVTGQPKPYGAFFDIDFVVHEMGHQLGAKHTFNAHCAGNQVAESAYEPGSGSSIMGYAGICGIGNDLQQHSDDYFHAKSLDQINIFLTDPTKGDLCASSSPSGNTPPVVASINKTYEVPYLTPFELQAPEAQDSDHDALTYCWEQYNLGDLGRTFAQTRLKGPILRSFMPTASRWRVFPILDSILVNNTNYLGEKLPDTSRVLTFRLTVRDIYNGHGTFNLSDDSVVLNVTKDAGPFLVTAPNNGNEYWQIGSSVNVQWDVAQTTAAPVSCSNVNIFLSVDGGYTYPIILASNTPNDGSEMVTVPSGSNTLAARVKVKAVNNVFFDISNHNFKINTWPLSAGSITASNDVTLYPIPADDVLYINSTSDDAYNVQVLNTVGQNVWNGSLEKQMSIPVGAWSSGVYYVQFVNQASNEIFIKKVLIN